MLNTYGDEYKVLEVFPVQEIAVETDHGERRVYAEVGTSAEKKADKRIGKVIMLEKAFYFGDPVPVFQTQEDQAVVMMGRIIRKRVKGKPMTWRTVNPIKGLAGK